MDATPFGPYQLQELLGRGGMGKVYRAYDTRTDRIVALKVLPPHLADDATFQQRFRRESQAAAALNEPHVVPIHGFGEIDGRLYLDMRLIDGRNLGTLLSEGSQPLGAAFAVNVVEQVAAALDAAHEAGLIHRDIKPSNILITARDFVYLIDFGLARSAGDLGLTTAGSTLGTMAYMAPERFEEGRADPRSDIYALTCVLYECLTGSRPYPADSLEQQVAGHMVAPPPRPSACDPRLAAFDDVIAKGMAKKPENRYQTAGELAAAARRAQVASAPSAHGRLVIGVNVPYAPNEFKDASGHIVGFDVDLMNAVARTLGLTPDYRESAFEDIIPGVQKGEFNVGMSSFTDTAARQEKVDFVTYLKAGTLWAQRRGGSVDPNNACGLKVGVVTGAIQGSDEIPTKSDDCVARDKPPIAKVVYATQDELTSALMAGDVDAMAADSPVAGFAIKTSGGALEAAGEVFNSAPYGWAVAKGSPLGESLRQALEHLMQTGEYRTIATMWVWIRE